jgi:GDPmannose 4,6-dehydratase
VKSKTLHLGNLDARRDWGHARDYVEALLLMLQDVPGDYVIATGETHPVRGFLTLACREIRARRGRNQVGGTESREMVMADCTQLGAASAVRPASPACLDSIAKA